MRIGVIGTFILDHAIFADGSELKGFGGIFYTLSILATLASPEDEIFPVCFLGHDIYNQVITKLSKYGNIKFDYINKISQDNTRVQLLYHDQEHRNEIISNLMPKLELKHLTKLENIDAWLINFITGVEMSLSTFSQFCKREKSPIFFDIHSLPLGIDPQGKRYLRCPANWQEWIKYVDVLQMNKAEASCLMKKDKVRQDELINFGRQIVNNNLKICHITLGSKGSLLFYYNQGQVVNVHIPPYPIQKVVDVTGSGDAFLSGFLIHYLKHENPVTAANYANFVAGMKCTIKGTEMLYQLKSVFNQTNEMG